MAVYNSARTLQRALDSVRDQNYEHKELVIIDGASTDGSVEILQANERWIDYWESEQDRGICHAWNKGLDHANGEWIHFLGADDYFMDSAVLTRVAKGLMKCSREIRVVYGKEAVVSSGGEVLKIWGDAWEKAGPQIVKEMSIPHPTVFLHRSIFESFGKFDESYRICADYHLLLKELKTGKALFIPDVVVKAVTYEGVSRRWDMLPTVVLETALAQRMNGLFPYRPSWIFFFARSIVKFSVFQMLGDKGTRQVVDLYRLLTGRPRLWTKME
ncbi:glycosyltransferase family 2 protein [Thermodesulfobacteriota bacterium]